MGVPIFVVAKTGNLQKSGKFIYRHRGAHSKESSEEDCQIQSFLV